MLRSSSKTAAVKPKVGKVALGLSMSFKNHNSTNALFNSVDLKTAAKKNKEVEDPYNSIFATENDEDCHTAVLQTNSKYMSKKIHHLARSIEPVKPAAMAVPEGMTPYSALKSRKTGGDSATPYSRLALKKPGSRRGTLQGEAGNGRQE
jgi:hypothetical protein